MFQGQKITAITFCGRKRYMDLLTPHIIREHDRGLIDKWLLFNNIRTNVEDATYAQQLKDHLPWSEVINRPPGASGEHAWTWNTFGSREGEGTIYLKIDDDVIYFDENALPRLLQYRVEHREPFLVYPLIVNNVRTSYRLQRAGQCPREWGEVTNDMNDWTAHKSFKWVFNIHRATLATLAAGKPLTERWSLPTEQFTTFDQGHISTNVITIFGSDLVACANMPAGYGCRAGVPDDDESFFSLWRPRQLNRQNARVGDSVFVHFAYNTQTDFMDHTGMLAEYAQFVAPMPFRVNQVAPPDTASVPHHPKGQRTPPPPPQPRNMYPPGVEPPPEPPRRAHLPTGQPRSWPRRYPGAGPRYPGGNKA